MGDPEKNWFTQKLEFYFFGWKRGRSSGRGSIGGYAALQLNELYTSTAAAGSAFGSSNLL